MTTIAVCSAKGSPGVSTVACVIGAVWPRSRRVVVAECDPSGNDIAARFGLSPLVGMTSLIISGRRSPVAPVDPHVQRLPGGLEVLVGPVSPDGARSIDRELGVAGASATFTGATDVVVDCGRLDLGAAGQMAVLGVADHVLVLIRPDAAGIAHARTSLASMEHRCGDATMRWFVDVGPTPFDRDDIERAVGVHGIGALPWEPAAAAVACGFPGRPQALARSALVHAARRMVDRLLARPGDIPIDPPGPTAARAVRATSRTLLRRGRYGLSGSGVAAGPAPDVRLVPDAPAGRRGRDVPGESEDTLQDAQDAHEDVHEDAPTGAHADAGMVAGVDW